MQRGTNLDFCCFPFCVLCLHRGYSSDRAAPYQWPTFVSLPCRQICRDSSYGTPHPPLRLIQSKTTAARVCGGPNKRKYFFATKLALSLMQMMLETSGKVECLPIGSARKLEDGEVRSAPCAIEGFLFLRQSTALQFDAKTS